MPSFVLRAPLATCLTRVNSREGGPLADPEVIERLWLDFTDLGDLEANVLDLDGATPDAAADALARLMADGRLAV
jgi:hypothetical protein